jgi:hypothetical protein
MFEKVWMDEQVKGVCIEGFADDEFFDALIEFVILNKGPFGRLSKSASFLI